MFVYGIIKDGQITDAKLESGVTILSACFDICGLRNIPDGEERVSLLALVDALSVEDGDIVVLKTKRSAIRKASIAGFNNTIAVNPIKAKIVWTWELEHVRSGDVDILPLNVFQYLPTFNSNIGASVLSLLTVFMATSGVALAFNGLTVLGLIVSIISLVLNFIMLRMSKRRRERLLSSAQLLLDNQKKRRALEALKQPEDAEQKDVEYSEFKGEYWSN